MSEMAGDSAPGRNPGLTLAEQMIEAHGAPRCGTGSIRCGPKSRLPDLASV